MADTVEGLVKRLRAKHADWQANCDEWVARIKAASPDKDWSEEEAKLRATDYDEAASALEALMVERDARHPLSDSEYTRLRSLGPLVDEVIGSRELLTAQNIIVHRVWELLGGEDSTRADGQNLVARVREVVARALAAEAQRDKAIEALRQLMDCSRAIVGANTSDDDASEAFDMYFDAQTRARSTLNEIAP